MLKGKTPLLVGLLVIAAAVAFIFTFGSLDQGLDVEDANDLYASFDDATGLVPGSRVMLSGIEVGRLGDITLDPKIADKARVQIYVKKGVKLRQGVLDEQSGVWVNGASAIRKQASLLGDYYVALSPGVAGRELGPGDSIPNVINESGLSAVIANFEKSTKQIFPKLDKITGDISAITGSLRATLGDEGAVETMRQIRKDVGTTTGNVAALTGELRNFLSESIYPRGQNLNQIMRNAQRTSEILAGTSAKSAERVERILMRLDKVAAQLGDFVEAQTASPEEAKEGTAAKALANLDKNMALLEGSLENVRAITANLEQGKGTVGRLLNDDKLINDIERVVAGVEDFTSVIGRTQIKVDFRADYFVQDSSYKSTISFSLHPTPDKYYLIQLIDDPFGTTSTTRRVTQSNNPLLPPVLVEDIAETDSDFKITAQFAKRVYALTFRYGIMESTGGIGIDLDLLNDHLNFQLDLFDFGRKDAPRLRLLAKWEFLRNVYVSAGIDQMLDGDARDYFVGLGVRFTDRDLIGILPFAPSP